MTDINSERIAEYSPIEAGLAELRAKYQGVVFDVSTWTGLEEAKRARADVRKPRYEVERIRKDVKAPAMAYLKRIDEEAKRITAEILAIEMPIDEVIKAEEERREKDRQEKAAAELKRVTDIQAAIASIRALPAKLMKSTAEQIDAVWQSMKDRELAADDFQEFIEQANAAKAEVLTQLHELYDQASAREAEAARLQAEREELERQRAELAEQRLANERREAAAAAEADRVAKLRERVAGIRSVVVAVASAPSMTAVEVNEFIQGVRSVVVDESWGELMAEAEEAKAAALERLQGMFTAAVRREVEAAELRVKHAELKAEQDRLDAQRREQEAETERQRQAKAKAELEAEMARRQRELEERQAAERKARGSQSVDVTDLVNTVSRHYAIDAEDAERWIVEAAAELMVVTA